MNIKEELSVETADRDENSLLERSTHLLYLRSSRTMQGCVNTKGILKNVHVKEMECMVVMSIYMLLLRFVKCLSVFVLYLKTRSLNH
jgi:hypothetical protein